MTELFSAEKPSLKKLKLHKSIKETAKWFKCGDCGEIQHAFGRNPYGASYYLCTLLHRCRTCVQKISIIGDGKMFYDLIDASELLKLEAQKK